jgi:hypothetical protein
MKMKLKISGILKALRNAEYCIKGHPYEDEMKLEITSAVLKELENAGYFKGHLQGAPKRTRDELKLERMKANLKLEIMSGILKSLQNAEYYIKVNDLNMAMRCVSWAKEELEAQVSEPAEGSDGSRIDG